MYVRVVQLQVQLAGAMVSFSGAGGDGRRDVVVAGCWTRLRLAPGRKLGDRRMGHPPSSRSESDTGAKNSLFTSLIRHSQVDIHAG
jgi:hypothetical protein